MSCKVSVDGPCQRTLSFSIDRSELDTEVESQVQEIARTASLKGFRKGKAPIAMIRKTHGKAVAEEARRRVMSKAFSDAVQEHELRPVGDPVMNLQALDDDDGDQLTFEFQVEVAPEIELSLPDRFEAEVVLPQITDEMVDAELGRQMERFGRLEDGVEGDALGDDDICEVSITYTVDGEHVASRSERPVFLRHELVDGLVIAGSRAVFSGGKVGDQVALTTTLPAHFQPEGWADREAAIEATIDRIRKVVVPESLDEEQLAAIGAESQEDLRNKIRQALDGQRAQSRFQQIDRAIEDRLLADHEFELPERLLSRTTDHKVHELAHQMMKQRGASSEDAHRLADERRGEVAEASRRGLGLAFLFDRIAHDKELRATGEETLDQVRALAAQQGADPEQAVQTAAREGWLGDVQEQLSTEKVRAWLRERVDVTEKEPDAPQEGAAPVTASDGDAAGE